MTIEDQDGAKEDKEEIVGAVDAGAAPTSSSSIGHSAIPSEGTTLLRIEGLRISFRVTHEQQREERVKREANTPINVGRSSRITAKEQDEQEKSADWAVALHELNLEIKAGQCHALVGESGSGKSISSLATMRLLPNGRTCKVEGKIWYNSDGAATPVDLLSLTEPQMRSLRGKDIALVFQEPMSALNPVMTVGKQVAEVLRLHLGLSKKQALDRVVSLFAEVQLPNPEVLIHAYPHQLSGGQKQRVVIAMAIACNPKVLLADEPTTALDVSVQASILALLQRLAKERGMGLLLITHDMGVVADMAHEITVLYKGQMMEHGPATQVLKTPSATYTRALLYCRPPLDRDFLRLPTLQSFMFERDGSLIQRPIGNLEILLKHAAPPNYKEDRWKQLMQQEVLLDVQNLSVTYQAHGKRKLFGKRNADSEFKALNNVSFQIRRGEVFGLVGESGSGKSSIARAILRLVNHSQGQALFNGTDILQLRGRALRQLRPQIQVVFQDPYGSLNPKLTVGYAIAEPLLVHGKAKNRTDAKFQVIDLLLRVGLEERHYNRYPHEFSGGQRQRIGIARAIALQPQLLIADEAVSALDVSVQAQILNLLNDLRDDMGLSILFISHDLSVVKHISDNMAVLKRGVVVEQGQSAAIYHAPQSAYTRSLIEAIPGTHAVGK